MTIKDFQDSLAAGTLKLEDVQAHLATLPAAASAQAGAEPATPAVEPAEDPAITALRAQVADLQAKVTAYGKEPGAGKTNAPMPDADPATPDAANTPQARLAAMNKVLAEAADKNEPAQFVIAQ